MESMTSSSLNSEATRLKLPSAFAFFLETAVNNGRPNPERVEPRQGRKFNPFELASVISLTTSDAPGLASHRSTCGYSN